MRAAGVDLMFSDAAGGNRAIRFVGGAGGHMPALQVAGQAREHRVARLVFAHIGRPSLRANRCRVPPAVRGMGRAGPHLPASFAPLTNSATRDMAVSLRTRGRTAA
jgi:hypothetical protein